MAGSARAGDGAAGGTLLPPALVPAALDPARRARCAASLPAAAATAAAVAIPRVGVLLLPACRPRNPPRWLQCARSTVGAKPKGRGFVRATAQAHHDAGTASSR